MDIELKKRVLSSRQIGEGGGGRKILRKKGREATVLKDETRITWFERKVRRREDGLRGFFGSFDSDEFREFPEL